MNFEDQAVRLCNIALLDLGNRVPIRRLVPETGAALSANEVICAEKYDLARRTVLRAHAWNFASRETHACPSPWHGNYYGGVQAWRFKVPAGCVRVVRCEGWAFRVIGDWVVTRSQVQSVEYTEDVEDLRAWDPITYRALAARLAADIADAVCGSGARDRAEAVYTGALESAKKQDAREAPDRDEPVDNPVWEAMRR